MIALVPARKAAPCVSLSTSQAGCRPFHTCARDKVEVVGVVKRKRGGPIIFWCVSKQGSEKTIQGC